MVRRISILLCLFIVTQISRVWAQEVFASFEDTEEVNGLVFSEGVLASRSEQFPAWGPNSLTVRFPEQGGRIRLAGVPADWGRQESLLVYVWSSQPSKLSVSLTDARGSAFTRPFGLRKGVNHLQLRLSEVTGVDLRRIESLEVISEASGEFFLDYVALDRFHPALEERGRWDVNYTLEVETPHVAWARPFAGGSIRAYAISPVRDGRGIIELAQRLSLDLKVTSIGRSPGINKWGFGEFYTHRSPGGEFFQVSAYNLAHAYIADDLLNGPEVDVIVWPGIHPWENYPAVILEEVRRRVESGTGLILINPRGQGSFDEISPLLLDKSQEQERDPSTWEAVGSHYITRGISLDSFPWGEIASLPARSLGQVLLQTSRGNPVLAVRTVGRGRVAAFSYPDRGLLPEVGNIWNPEITHPYYEYMWSLLARAVVWVSRRESGPAILSFESDPESLRFDLGGEIEEGSRVTIRVRNEFGEVETEAVVPAQSGTERYQLPSFLEGGLHYAEAVLKSDRGAFDWASRRFRTPKRVEIAEIQPRSESFQAGEKVPVKVVIRAPEVSSVNLEVRLFDNYGRLIARQNFQEPVAGEKVFESDLDSSACLTHIAKVDCEVFVNGVRNDRRVKEVFIRRPRKWDDYDITMYRFGPDPLPGAWPVIDRQLKKLHVTTLAAYSLEHSRHANYNIQAQTRISGQESPDGPRRDYYTNMKARYLSTKNKRGLIREFCLNDPAYRELVRQELKRMIPTWAPFSPTSYYVYEEPSLTCYGDAVDICFSDHCMRRMREWLKEGYGSLEALNRKWGTDFGSWEVVLPDDTYQAQERGNYASWADHRTFMEITYADAFRFVLDELHKYDPNGILLNSGTQISGSHNGCDYSRINLYTEHLNAYSGGNQLDFHRNFNPRLKISGGAGYGVLGEDVLFDFYSNLFKGSNAGAYIFWEYSTLNPDLTLCQSGLDMAAGFQEMRGEGIGKLVGLGSPDNYGVAIHYSYPSLHGSWIVDGQIFERVSYNTSSTFTRFGNNRDGWVKVLRDSGLQFDFIAYSDIENGDLESKGYRVLILPMSVALSDREVEAIQAFVRAGGVVMADALTGAMDEHNSFRPQRALADVFGIQPEAISKEAIIAMQGEPHLTLEGAQPISGLEGPPRVLHNSFGQGQAFLLNFFLDGYPEARREGTHTEFLQQVGLAFSKAGLAPKAVLESADGKRITNCSMYLFANGSTRLLGLVPDKDRPHRETVRLQLDESATVYDVRRKQRLGTGKRFQIQLQRAVPELLALVAGEVESLHIEGPDRKRRGETIELEFRLAGVPDLRSVARMTVTDPQGQEVLFYSGNLDVVNGAGSALFPTALNDPTGTWKIELTDVISGVSAVHQVLLQ